ALVGLGQLDRASEALESAVIVLQATGSRWHLWEIAALLAELAEERGDSTAANQWKTTASETIQAIVDQISDPRLRTIFLDQSRVHQLLPLAD
ncbi:MAG: hypothetical protein M3220_21410, partial [Chloroflexota bacterium]|nr:hypothetical protein [Chloroflexota bacterium]